MLAEITRVRTSGSRGKLATSFRPSSTCCMQPHCLKLKAKLSMSLAGSPLRYSHLAHSLRVLLRSLGSKAWFSFSSRCNSPDVSCLWQFSYCDSCSLSEPSSSAYSRVWSLSCPCASVIPFALPLAVLFSSPYTVSTVTAHCFAV